MDLFDDAEDAAEEEALKPEATVWVEGLDRIQRLRGINFCADFSATPFYLARMGTEANLPEFRNTDDEIRTIRVDTKVVYETDTGEAKADEIQWMRHTLDTIGKSAWPTDRQGRPIHPEGFETLARKLERPLHPPGRDVRCIVSVGMLTEGWDCNSVTHIIGLRPFMSQLLCEQVVGRGLRRMNYQVDEDGKFSEEVAKIFGVPSEKRYATELVSYSRNKRLRSPRIGEKGGGPALGRCREYQRPIRSVAVRAGERDIAYCNGS